MPEPTEKLGRSTTGAEEDFGALFERSLKSPKQGADTGVFLATEDVAENGQYFYKRKVHPTKNDALDPALGARVWDDCAALVGLS